MAPVSDTESGDVASLNAAQRDVVDQLGARRGGRPQFDAELRHELLHLLESRLGPILADLEPDTTFFVSKRKLSMAHGCEARYLSKDEFVWSVPVARGVPRTCTGISWAFAVSSSQTSRPSGCWKRKVAE